MPTFDFQCQQCERIVQKLCQKGETSFSCLHCGGTLKKMISAPAVHFKGSGFFSTESRKGKCESCPAQESCGKKV